MKIDPTNPSPAATHTVPARSNNKGQNDDFASVFKTQMDRKPDPSLNSPPQLSPMMPPSLRMEHRMSAQAQTASDLLDGMDQYRQLLADSRATLRDIAPVVETIEKKSAKAQKMLADMAETNPVKDVLQETVLMINKEVERFKLGVYLEE